jgi:hypothetical protein
VEQARQKQKNIYHLGERWIGLWTWLANELYNDFSNASKDKDHGSYRLALESLKDELGA